MRGITLFVPQYKQRSNTMPRYSNDLISKIAAAMSRRRKTFSGGRPKTLRPCPHCGAEMGARELKAHKPHCDGAQNKQR